MDYNLVPETFNLDYLAENHDMAIFDTSIVPVQDGRNHTALRASELTSTFNSKNSNLFTVVEVWNELNANPKKRPCVDLASAIESRVLKVDQYPKQYPMVLDFILREDQSEKVIKYKRPNPMTDIILATASTAYSVADQNCALLTRDKGLSILTTDISQKLKSDKPVNVYFLLPNGKFALWQHYAELYKNNKIEKKNRQRESRRLAILALSKK